LIDAGRQALERATGAQVPLAERSHRWLRAHAAGAYFGSLFVITLATVMAPLFFMTGSVPGVTLGLLGLLLLLPASELAVLAVNYLVTSLLPPQVLPKMSFKKKAFQMIAAPWWWSRRYLPLQMQSKASSTASKFAISEIRMRICASRS
jgi:hypothetical protein